MDILYQYYNEIVLTFGDYLVDFQDQVIVIEVPDDNKPFDLVCDKIKTQLSRIAETLDPRDKDITVRVERTGFVKDLVLERDI